METMRTFTAGRFTVKAMIEPDYDTDLSWDETGETVDKLNSGEWFAFQTKVAVYLDSHEIAADYLGGSIYAEPRDFFTEHLGMNAKGHGSYFSDMVREAIREAREYVRQLQPVYVRAA